MSSGNYVAPTAINNALAACGQGHVVYVNAGTYYFSGSITLGNQNGVTLRMNDGAKLIFNAAPAVTWYNGAGAIFHNPPIGPHPAMRLGRTSLRCRL